MNNFILINEFTSPRGEIRPLQWPPALIYFAIKTLKHLYEDIKVKTSMKTLYNTLLLPPKNSSANPLNA